MDKKSSENTIKEETHIVIIDNSKNRRIYKIQ